MAAWPLEGPQMLDLLIAIFADAAAAGDWNTAEALALEVLR